MAQKFTRTEKSWIMYDWANSVYATIIMAAVFPIYFASVAKSQGLAGDVWWGYVSSASSLIIALAAPFLGALGDFKGFKKKLLVAFLAVGVAFTLLMAVTDNVILLLLGYALSRIGFAGSNLFYDSFLTDVTTSERMDRVSAYGYALGYIGGSTIPFVIFILLNSFGGLIGISSILAVKIAVVMTALWWLLFSLPLLKNVHQVHYVETPPEKLTGSALSNLKKTVSELWENKPLLYFILAYFFYIDGVSTVITMSTSYGSVLGLGTTAMVLALLLTQLLAFPFCLLFGRLSERLGTRVMLKAGVIIYMLVCLLGFYMGFSLEQATDYESAVQFSTVLFWILAVLVSTSQGGLQALSRSYYGKLIPPERSNEYFGFFDIFGKFASVIGPALYASSAALTGRSSLGILSLLLLFIVGLALLILGEGKMKSTQPAK